MVNKSEPGKPLKEADAETKLQEALARVKLASDRHAAVVSVVSRVGVSAQDKRLAQAEGKKVDQELRDAKRLLRDAQSLTRK
ncbi:MAG: hypothetical protein V4787_24345 [Pseudomonadota bacterium]